MSERRGWRGAALAGALTALAFWGLDLLSLSELSFAGVSDAAAQARVVAATQAEILGVEVRLAASHLLIGAVWGALTALALAPRAWGGWRRAALGAAAMLALQALALFGMWARYPQLYADRIWLRGGLNAQAMRLVTHTLGPWPFDLALALLATVLLGRCVWRLQPFLRRWPRSAWVVLSVLMALLLAGRMAPRRQRADARPNVLILALDSLRGDRIDDPAVMPFTAGLLPRGSLWRYAFVPVARTFPSWVSTLTGTEPRHNGVRTMFPRHEPRARLGPTFASLLRDEGYRTFVTADFAGDVFPRFPGGFEQVDAPNVTVDTLAAATVLSAHAWSLPMLRVPALRDVFPEWRNLASLSDPEWLTDRALGLVEASDGRPFLGVVFYSTSHFPYVPPYPDYRRGAGSYRGPFLYHAPPTASPSDTTQEDIVQIRARYDGGLHSVDRALARLCAELERQGLLSNTIVAVTGDHGEELFDQGRAFGHGDVLSLPVSESVPIFLLGPGVPAGRKSQSQVRLLDLGATLLDLIQRPPQPARFGDGVSLLAEEQERPLCIETGIWFWPDRPAALRGQRLTYPGVSELLEIEPVSREMVLKREYHVPVETFKERGLVLGDRYWHERLTPLGRVGSVGTIAGPVALQPARDLGALFEQRCVAGDPRLRRFFDALVYEP